VDCGRIQEKLTAYADGQLNPKERETVEEHLRVCPACRESALQAQRLSNLLVSVPALPVPTDLTAQIQAAVRNRSARSKIHRMPAIMVWWREASVPLRAAASFILVVTFALGTLMSLKITQATSRPLEPVVDYGLNSFAGAPDGSLEQAYLDLLTTSNGGEQ